MTDYTARERRIAKLLSLTDAGLATLLRIHRGDPISGGSAGIKLEALGLVTPCPRHLTRSGEARLAEARRRGY
jgi:hypothetical protein